MIQENSGQMINGWRLFGGLQKSTIQRGLLATFGILIITLTGVFDTFARQQVIPNQLSLNTVIIVLMVGMTAYACALPLRNSSPLVAMMNAIVGTLFLAVMWTVLVWFSSIVDMRFVFRNLISLNPSPLTFGEVVRFVPTETEGIELGGLMMLWLFCAMMGAVAGFTVILPRRMQTIVGVSGGLTIVLSMLASKINGIITLPDALGLIMVVGVAYSLTWVGLRRLSKVPAQWQVMVFGAVIGISIAGLLWAMSDGFLRVRGSVPDGMSVMVQHTPLIPMEIGDIDPFARGGILRGTGTAPQIISMGTRDLGLAMVALFAFVGMAGALAVKAEPLSHNSMLYFVAILAILGILNASGRNIPVEAPLLIFAILVIIQIITPPLGEQAEGRFERLSRGGRWQSRGTFMLVFAGVVMVAPQFMGVSLANNMNLIILYATLGIGLNVMIGYTGLLDLGFVASIAIGAYTIGILTGPNILTCNGVAINPNLITLEEINVLCTGRTDFWTALPIAVVMSGVTGALLGVPVLGLRGDYLAIVTLGFGEIVNRIIFSDKFKPLMGGAQGLSPIPVPEILLPIGDEGVSLIFGNATSVFYLYVIGFFLAIVITYRLSISRQGRSWRAIRADEDVAEAMGIHKVRNKLMAFAVSSAIGGLGGAILAAQLQSVTPENYKLAFSINVLALIIIGGMGSIPGVILGAVVLAGLPELLRELETYRLLAFGSLLVVVMLSKPEGLMPPKPPQLAEQAQEWMSTEQAKG